MKRHDTNYGGWGVLWSAWSCYPYFLPSLALITFGATLLMPGETFRSSVGFSGMASLMTEDHWGMGMIAIGGVQILAMLFVPWIARHLLMLVWLPFSFVSLTFWLNSPLPSTGVGMYALVALLVLWSFTKWGARWPG